MVVEILLVMVVLTFITFNGLDVWVLMSKHQYAEHIAEKYLQRMAIEGRLSTADENAMTAEFAGISAPVETITAQRESQGNPRVLRNPADLDGSTVLLRVVARPNPEPMLIGRVIGAVTPGAGYRIIVGGEALSEHINP